MTRDELAAAGVHVERAAHERLKLFVELLLEENTKLNLTSIREPRAVWEVHICDALSLLPLLDVLRPESLLDLGTGGGIPGLPLACVRTDLVITLLDSVRKKLLAVNGMIDRIGLPNARVALGRSETLAHERAFREKYDAAVVRAVAGLPTLAEYASGFVRRGGQCWFEKAATAVEQEIAAAERAAGACGLKFAKLHRFMLPGDHGERVVAVYEKRGLLRKDLPRAVGLPKRKPL